MKTLKSSLDKYSSAVVDVPAMVARGEHMLTITIPHSSFSVGKLVKNLNILLRKKVGSLIPLTPEEWKGIGGRYLLAPTWKPGPLHYNLFEGIMKFLGVGATPKAISIVWNSSNVVFLLMGKNICNAILAK